MIQLISLFKQNEWKITVASTSKKTEFSAHLKALDIQTAQIEINSSSFDRFIQKIQPNIVIFDRFIIEEQFGWRVAEYCPQAIRILDTEDLHCLRKARRNTVEEGRPFKPKELLQSDIAKREVAAILRSDLSLIISDSEMDLLENLFNIDEALLHYLPFLLQPIPKTTFNNGFGFNERKHFITVGNFRHAPNRDAIYYLKNKIWPQIHKKLPGAQMHIYGAYPSAEIGTLHQPAEGFFIKGRADDAQAVVSRARICLAPLRFGAGLKGKLIEAMQCGTPSITTGIGAEGLNGRLDWPGVIADSAAEFAAAATALYSDEKKWEKAQLQGVKIINSRFLKHAFGPAFLERICSLQQNLQQHRTDNFTGAMLLHHTAESTKYKARWIEEKNKWR